MWLVIDFRELACAVSHVCQKSPTKTALHERTVFLKIRLIVQLFQDETFQWIRPAPVQSESWSNLFHTDDLATEEICLQSTIPLSIGMRMTHRQQFKLQIFRPSATKSGRPHGVTSVSSLSWKTPPPPLADPPPRLSVTKRAALWSHHGGPLPPSG